MEAGKRKAWIRKTRYELPNRCPRRYTQQIKGPHRCQVQFDGFCWSGRLSCKKTYAFASILSSQSNTVSLQQKATHELFFSSQTLYVLVWDMANSIPIIMKTSSLDDDDQGDFTLQYDSSDDEDYFFENVEMRRAIRALEKDIDEKLNFWVHTIQSSAPGAAILPVCSTYAGNQLDTCADF
jgi:hypothetical protein